MRRTPILLPLLLALALMAATAPATARSKMVLGAADPYAGGPDVAAVQAGVNAYVAKVGTKPRMWSLWSKWGERGANSAGPCVKGTGSCAFPSEAVAWLHEQGITPVIWWAYNDPKDRDSNLYARYKKILSGRHDDYITSWAVAARKAGRSSGMPVIVRPFHEATGHWFPWSIGLKDNTVRNYKEAWNYLGKKFRQNGADPHVRWLWSLVQPKRWAYPGDKYVDYVGISVSNFGSPRPWRWGIKQINSAVAAAQEFTTKPIIAAEIVTAYKGGNKGKWIRETYVKAYRKHPQFKGFIYEDSDHPKNTRGHPDWRLQVGDQGAGLKEYRKLADQARFKGRIR